MTTPVTALFVIDLQENLLATLPESDGLLARCAFAIESARLLNIPIAFFEQRPDKLGSTARPLKKLKSKQDAYWTKDSFSALKDPATLEWIEKQKIEQLLIIGIETGICVYQTAIHALRKKLKVTLLTDCVQARRLADGERALGQLARFNCVLLPSETVFYALFENADHPAFRAFTSLVKHA